ncbi:MAG: hypothetical protein IPL79_08775 [Myxococcales bacterium]|nr:hypothetical protein [Myxococcales bacterium]
MPQPYLVHLAFLLGSVVACAAKPDTAPPPPPGDPTLEVRLASASFQVIDGAATGAAITVVAIAPDGSETDVTAEVSLVAEPAGIGAIAAQTLLPTGDIAGAGRVVAFDGTRSASAAFEVYVSKTLPGDVSPTDAGLFGVATPGSGTAIALNYPPAGALIPPNLGEMDVHWTDGSASNLFEISLTGTYVNIKAYVAGASATHWHTLAAEHWALVASGARGQELTIAVRGLHTAAPSTFAAGELAVRIASQEVLGGVYFWNATAGAIMRHDMATPDLAPTRFYPPVGQTGCVGCHAISRDGTLVAYRQEGGNLNYGNVVAADTLTRTLTLNTQQWNFAAIHPNNNDMFTTTTNGLHLTDLATGVVTALYGASRISHPEVSADGQTVVATALSSGDEVWAAEGRIVAFAYDDVAKTVAAPTTLADPAGATFAYYPSISPDNEWVLYNQATSGSSYDNPNAELWITRLDGSGVPIHLTQADAPSTTYNSWPKWTPFAGTEPTLEGATEPVMWFTVSSRRAFGVRSTAPQKPQLWLVPFYPDRAAAGQPASAPPIRLPFQALGQGNHIAQWTEQIVGVN